MFRNGFGFTKVYQWWVRGIPDDAEGFPPSSHNTLPWEKLGVLWTSLNNYKVHTQSKEYRGSALRNHHEKAQGSCALSRRSLAGDVILDYISFPVCNFWRESFDVRLYVQSRSNWVTFLPTWPDCAAAESHVLKENSHRRIQPNIGFSAQSSTMAVLCTPQETAVMERRGRATRIRISTRFMPSELQSWSEIIGHLAFH